jgi:hypothetical protein
VGLKKSLKTRRDMLLELGDAKHGQAKLVLRKIKSRIAPYGGGILTAM